MWTQTHPLDFHQVGHLSPVSKPLAEDDRAPGTTRAHGQMEAVHDVLEEFYSALVGKRAPGKQHEPRRASGPHRPSTTSTNMRTLPAVGPRSQLVC